MAETSAGFAKAIAYCLEYDYWHNASDPEGWRRFLAGVTPQTGDESFSQRLRDLAHFVSCALPKTDDVDARHTTLQQIHAQAVQLNDPKLALVMGGATKIKQYVFESARLPEIRGASALLDRINLVDMPALFNKRPRDVQHIPQVDRVRQQFAERYRQFPPDCPECVIYANGGEILAFAPVALAQSLADAIEFLYTSETLVANSVAVWQSFSLVELVGGIEPLAFWQRWSEKTYRDHLASLLGKRSVEELLYKKCFGELAAALAGTKFQRREGNPSLDRRSNTHRPAKSVPHWETFAYGQRCSSCERRLASQTYPIAGEIQPVCDACWRKLDEGRVLKRGWVTEFEDFLWGTGREDAYYGVEDHGELRDVRRECPLRSWDRRPLPDRPQDLSEIGQAVHPQGYIGVVYADGNNMGALLEKLRSPVEYQHFAEQVYTVTQNAVFDALATTLQPAYVSRKMLKTTTQTWVHPFEILSIGGDDLFLIVPASAALPLAIKIAQYVEGHLAKDPFFHVAQQEQRQEKRQDVHRCTVEQESAVDGGVQSTVGLSTGVLLADAKTPIFFLQGLVEQLLKSAKARAKSLKKTADYYGGAIDFMALKSVTMITSALKEFRESTLRVDQASLTARPYTLVELQCLIDTVRALKAIDFPRSQLYALRSMLWEGRFASTVDYLYFTERLSREKREQLRAVLDQRWCQKTPAPWRPVASGPYAWETVLFDVLELYGFV